VKEDEPLNIDDFAPLSPLVRGYEFRPGCAYLIICSAEKFNLRAAQSLFKDIMELHSDLQIAVVATPYPKSIEIKQNISDEGSDQS
jgi:hypothetical protein